MDVEITPEPEGDGRDAIVAALALAGVGERPPAGYESPWRAAGLREAAEPEDAEP